MTPIRLVAVVGPTATGKSALGLSLARALGGEIVACDSTAVYRGIDIGTDKVPAAEQGGIPHHMVDLVAPTETYSAARYATDAAGVIRDIAARRRVPILVGGSGFYYRALVRGLFPGPPRHDAIRARLDLVAERRGVESLHRWLGRVDPSSAERILPRDQKRLVRALEVHLVTGRPLSEHFKDTRPALGGLEVLPIGLTLARDLLRDRVSLRVDQQFARGVIDEVRTLTAAGVPAGAHAFSGLVYRQVIEHLAGVRDEAATRDLIVRENMRYARRQVSWFRSEAGVVWITGPGESPPAQAEALTRARVFLRAAQAVGRG